MLTAINGFIELASQRPYDRDRMVDEAADTYRRLIWVQLQAGQTASVRSDLNAMEDLIKRIKDPTRVRTLVAGLNELRAVIDPTSKFTTLDSATQTNQQATASPQAEVPERR
jgi:hypothetical protein